MEIREILESSPKFDDKIIKKLLVRHDLNHLMLTDVNKVVAMIAKEFPEIVKLSTIGTSWGGRPIVMITLDVKGKVPL